MPSPRAEQDPHRPGPVAVAPEEPSEIRAAVDTCRISLSGFEGPLDLLLHLIQKHELDILDIPVSFITEKYLEYLDLMHSLRIDVASEHLVMAATLALIKSRMLLPAPAADGDDRVEEGEDPRGELVRRLLEYQKYKHAAEQLVRRPVLDRDVFERGSQALEADGPAPFAPTSVFKLFDAFDQVLRRSHRTALHEVVLERVSIAQRIVELTEILHERRRLTFAQLFGRDAGAVPGAVSRFDLVVTFLALLELCRLRLAWVIQDEPLGELVVTSRPVESARSEAAGITAGDPVPDATSE